jgi:autotransporter-associated beta strand protein
MKPLHSSYRLRSLSWVGLTVYSAIISADAQMTINRLITDGSLVPDRGDYVKSFTIEDTGFATLSGVSVTVNLSSPNASNPMWFGDMFASLTHGTASESERMAVLFNRPGVSAEDPWGNEASSLSQTYDVSGALAGAWLPSNRWSLLVSDSQQGGIARLDSLSLTLTGSLGGNAEAVFRPGDTVSGSGAVNGQVNLTTTSPDASVAATIGASESLHFGGGMVGNAKLVKHGGGELVIGRVNGGNGGAGAQGVPSANDYSGEIEVSEGSLRLIGNDALGSGARIKLGGGGVELRLDADTAVSNAVTLAAAASLSKVQVASGNASISAGMGGAGGFEKSGAGTLTIGGTNTYTGATKVSDGRLVVNGNISTSSLTTVTGTGILSGSGTLGAVSIAGTGTHSPGNSPGIVNTNDYTMAGSLNIEALGTTPGVSYDQVKVTGSVNLSGVLSTDFTGSSFVNGNMLFFLLNDGTDAVTGTFAGLEQGAIVASGGGFDWQISYNANGDSSGSPSFFGGNDVALMAIPEPSSALLGGLASLLLLRRRRPVA